MKDQAKERGTTAIRRAKAARWLSGLVLGLAMIGNTAGAAAADPGLAIELNKAEDSEGSCLATFVVTNRLGETLDRFSLDLFVFDQDGVISRQVLVDLAPLRRDKTQVTRFVLTQKSCDGAGRVLVNDIPSCRAEGGADLDCLEGLSVSSRGRIELVK